MRRDIGLLRGDVTGYALFFPFPLHTQYCTSLGGIPRQNLTPLFHTHSKKIIFLTHSLALTLNTRGHHSRSPRTDVHHSPSRPPLAFASHNHHTLWPLTLTHPSHPPITRTRVQPHTPDHNPQPPLILIRIPNQFAFVDSL